MAKKVILKDDNIEIMPITRGELVLDSSGQLAFHSSQFLATQSLPGLMSAADKTKLDNTQSAVVDTALSTTSTNAVLNKVITTGINEAKTLANNALDAADDALDTANSAQSIANAIKASYLKSASVSGNLLTLTDLDDEETKFNNTTYTFESGSNGSFIVTPVGGKAQTVTVGGVLTDDKVKQTNTTSSGSYRLLFSYTADNTTRTEGARKSSKLLFNPETGALTATSFSGNLAWSSLTGVPETFAPSAHNHPTSQINALTSYTKATAAAALATTDSLNAALGKLEYKLDVAYDLVTKANDSDGTIENLKEILDVLAGIKDTETIKAIVGKYLPLAGGTLTGNLWFGAGNTDKYITFTSATTGTDASNSWRIGYIGSGSGDRNHFVLQSTKATTNTWTSALTITNEGLAATFAGALTAAKFVGPLNSTLTFSAGAFSAKTYNNSAAVTVNIPTHTSHLTNNSGFLTKHQSLANYVTLNGDLTISGVKTFSKQLKFTVTTGSPFTVSSTTKVPNLNSDMVDGYHISTAGTTKPWSTIVTIGSDGVSEMGRYIDFHYDNTTGSDYSTRLLCRGNHSNVVTLPSATGTLALTSQIPSVGNGTVTIKLAGSTKGSFTMNQSGNTTIELTDNNTTYDLGISDYTVKINGTTKNFVRDWGHGAANMNAVARGGRSSVGMADLSTPSGGTATAVNPNGGTSWHHFINISYTDGGAGSNSWVTQIANKAGTTDLWVRSRSGGTISDTAAWTAGWTRILTGSNYTNITDGRYIKKSGDTMTGPLTISTSNWGNLLVLNRVNNGENWGPSIIFKFDGTHNGALSMQSNLLYIGDNGNVRYKAWHEGNDGSGSGLDADLLDGKHASAFALASHGVHWEGFTKRANSNASWGTLIASNGYTPLFWLDSNNNGGVAFSDKGGQTFMLIDGYFYQNEGKYRVTDVTETVTDLGTSGNNLTWTKNGTTNNITIPYATVASALHYGTFNTASQITTSYAQWTNNSGCSDVTSMGYAALLNVGYGNYRWWQIWNSRNDHQLYWRPEKADASGWADVHVLLDNYNFKNYVDDMYWANIKVSSSSNDKTTPTFANTTVNGIVTVNGPQNALTINSSCKAAYADFIRMLNPNMSSTYHTAHLAFGYALSAYNLGYIGFKFVEKDSKSNMVTIGLHSADHILNVLANGKVGIGTTSPSELLHVNGTGRVDNIHLKSTYINLNRNGSDSSIYDSTKTALEIEATTDLSILRTYNVTTKASIVLHKNGCIGIGTLTPTERLLVNGNIKIQGTSNTSTTPDIYLGYYTSWNGTSYPTLMSGYGSKWIMHFNPHICRSTSTDMPGANIRLESINKQYFDVSVGHDGLDTFKVRYDNSKNVLTISNTGQVNLINSIVFTGSVGASAGTYLAGTGTDGLFLAANESGKKVFLESTNQDSPWFRNKNGDYAILHTGNASVFHRSDFTFTDGTTVADWTKATSATRYAGNWFSVNGWAWANSSNINVGGNLLDRMRYSALSIRNGNLTSTWAQQAILFIPTYADSGVIYLAQMTTSATAGSVSTTIKYYGDVGYNDGRYVNVTGDTMTGNLTAPAFYASSDINLKINIQEILNSDKMPIIKEFDWKEDGSHSYGLIAQELEEQGYSELVSTKDDGYKTVNYSAALSLIVGKLQVKIKELEKEIEILKNKN